MKFPPINLWSYPKMTNSIVNNAEKAIVEIALILGIDANTETIKETILDLLKTKDDLEMTQAAEISLRGQDWLKFSNKVLHHIENYTVPQYGDKGEDQVTDYTSEDCVKQISRYVARHGKNQREGQTELDMFKIAHYNQLAFDKLNNAS